MTDQEGSRGIEDTIKVLLLTNSTLATSVRRLLQASDQIGVDLQLADSYGAAITSLNGQSVLLVPEHYLQDTGVEAARELVAAARTRSPTPKVLVYGASGNEYFVEKEAERIGADGGVIVPDSKGRTLHQQLEEYRT